VPSFDLRACKAEARRLLPPGHPLRTLIESEPDDLIGADAPARLTMLLRVVLAHRRSTRVA
jgi:hypothetical protein